MIGAVIDIGDNLLQAVVTIIGFATVLANQWRTNKAVSETKAMAHAAKEVAAGTKEATAFVAAQLVENGGSSVKDQLNRLEQRIANTGEVPVTVVVTPAPPSTPPEPGSTVP
jgi:hypothetical protein